MLQKKAGTVIEKVCQKASFQKWGHFDMMELWQRHWTLHFQQWTQGWLQYRVWIQWIHTETSQAKMFPLS